MLTRLALVLRWPLQGVVPKEVRVDPMMTIRRLSVGSGYKYLLKSIAVGDGPEGADTSDLVRYYTETGTPPGVFLGAGLVGSRWRSRRRGRSDASPQRTCNACSRTAPIPSPARCSDAPRARRPSAVSTSRSVPRRACRWPGPWPIARPATSSTDATKQPSPTVLAYAEREVFTTRSGQQGCVEEDIVGVVAASFTHFDSRDGDPQLHDHVVVLNRVQATSDGLWRTLDSRGLFASAVMLSEMHQGVLSDLLTARTRLGLGSRTPGVPVPSPKWEVAGVSDALMEEFSRRTADIVAAKDRLIDTVRNRSRSRTDRRRSPEACARRRRSPPDAPSRVEASES